MYLIFLFYVSSLWVLNFKLNFSFIFCKKKSFYICRLVYFKALHIDEMLDKSKSFE